MTGLVGADADDLEEAAAQLSKTGSDFGQVGRPIRHQLYSTRWEGRNADQFRHDWDRTFGPALQRAEVFLHEAATKLRKNASDQRRISSVNHGPRGPQGNRSPVTGKSSLIPIWGPSSLPGKLGELIREAASFLELLGALGEFGAEGGMLVRLFKGLGGRMGGVLSGIGGIFSLYDLLFDDEGYKGAHAWIERGSDVLGIIAGGLGVASLVAGGTIVGAPAGVVLGIASLAVGGAALVVDIGLRTWTTGGREMFQSTVKSASDSIRQATGSISRGWDIPHKIGRFPSERLDSSLPTIKPTIDRVYPPYFNPFPNERPYDSAREVRFTLL